MGDIDEVIIPPKRNAGGKRYGFVRFLNVKDDRLLTTKLETIFLDGRKIFSNIPRFQMKEVIKGKGNRFHIVGSSVQSKAHMKFHSNVEEMSKFAKAYVGVVENLGQSYIINDNTRRGIRMDVARYMIRTRCASVINEVLNIFTNAKMFIIKLMEEAQCPMDILSSRNLKFKGDSESSEFESKRCPGSLDMEE
ncbi:hypothetical protein KIW84_051278 [Lathyrus oleraceus]|uniref:RRM domain-containing protein n=1 Tax=Pisum sativum TaxID=3888 RepID=A0A9D4WM24_PEA|nr:hypothetical protein KIW84_051278 [Pisum sativum]